MDSTQRKQIKETANESGQTLQAVMEASPLAMVAINREGHVTMWNPSATRLFGWSQREILARFPLIIPEDRRDEFRKQMDLGLRGHTSTGFETCGRKKDGSLVRVSLSTAPLRNSKGDITGVVALIADITEYKRPEQKLVETVVELEKRNKELEEFIYTISHDLKNPLISIQGFLAQLHGALKNRLGEEEWFYFRRIEANARRLEAFVCDLLELSKIGRTNDLEVVDLGRVIEETLRSLDSELSTKKIQVAVQEGFPQILASPNQMNQVFTNLIQNAIIYKNSEAPRIEIGCRDGHDNWLVYVKDNGIGIPDVYHEKIFNIFQRLPEAISLYPEGTGTGLAVVRKIIESLGGNVWLESEVGQGTTFYLTLPKMKVGNDPPSQTV